MATCTNLHPAVNPAALAQLRSDLSKEIQLSVGGRTIIIFFNTEENQLFMRISKVFVQVLPTDQRVLSACQQLEKTGENIYDTIDLITIDFWNNHFSEFTSVASHPENLQYNDQGKDIFHQCPIQHTWPDQVREKQERIWSHFIQLNGRYESMLCSRVQVNPGVWTLGEGSETVSFEIPETVKSTQCCRN